jgi:SAM-dependent methyltransferase
MLSILEQLAQGKLVCPQTHQPLEMLNEAIATRSGTPRYPCIEGVPILLAGAEQRQAYHQEQEGAMFAEYQRTAPPSRVLAAVDRLVASQGDFRNPAASAAFEAIVVQQPADALCLAVGGGPTRAHPNLVNLNIDRFANVDVVADAYALPYANGAVDAVHCEAVLEHLEYPDRAVREMFRALRPGGQVLAVTPFLQAFHAYPNHFQNFTLEGHNRLFERAGFQIVSAGACVGPTFALTDLAALYFRNYLPTRILSRGVQRLVALGGLLVRPLDRLVLRDPQAHKLASTVYAHLTKPG